MYAQGKNSQLANKHTSTDQRLHGEALSTTWSEPPKNKLYKVNFKNMKTFLLWGYQLQAQNPY